MITYAIAGTLLGLSAGFAPGPLLTLVVAVSLRGGIGEGVKAALAPLITDLPIIAVSFLLLAQLSDAKFALGSISLAGACFVLYIAIENIRVKGADIQAEETNSGAIRKGVIVNALSPHPYIFWLTVGAPTVVKAVDVHPGAAAAFVFLFYFFLVGSKIFLAVAAGKSRAFLSGAVYVNIMRVLGVLLILFAAFLAWDGLKIMGVV